MTNMCSLIVLGSSSLLLTPSTASTAWRYKIETWRETLLMSKYSVCVSWSLDSVSQFLISVLFFLVWPEARVALYQFRVFLRFCFEIQVIRLLSRNCSLLPFHGVLSLVLFSVLLFFFVFLLWLHVSFLWSLLLWSLSGLSSWWMSHVFEDVSQILGFVFAFL